MLDVLCVVAALLMVADYALVLGQCVGGAQSQSLLVSLQAAVGVTLLLWLYGRLP